jgi:uncharacterized protein YndB with AHSA1/START domain
MSKLKVSLEGSTAVVMVREFDAPIRLVRQAMTTPELITQWLGGVRATVVSARVDLRVGGAFRYLFRRHDGVEFAISGVYREVGEARLAHTERMEGMPGEALVTTTFAERDGKTVMQLVMRFESAAVRDAVVGTGMADGAGESYDSLEHLLAQGRQV